jgi:hypothetical protein
VVARLDASSSKGSGHDAGHDAGHHVAKGVDAADAKEDVSSEQEASVDAGSDVVDSGYQYDGPVFTVEAGVTWSSLYRDYFGPTGVASCEAQGFCHGTTAGTGYSVSGFLCPKGDGGVTACWQSITATDAAAADLVPPDAGFDGDNLSLVLCAQSNPEGSMPTDGEETCHYYFTATDLQRISAWVAAGALDN